MVGCRSFFPWYWWVRGFHHYHGGRLRCPSAILVARGLQLEGSNEKFKGPNNCNDLSQIEMVGIQVLSSLRGLSGVVYTQIRLLLYTVLG